jgi:porin
LQSARSALLPAIVLLGLVVLPSDIAHAHHPASNPTGHKEAPAGATYGSVLYMAVDADLAKLAGLPGMTFRANTYQIQGANIFNFSTISGFAALPTARLFELWAEQKLFADLASVRFGQLTADNEFFISEFATSLFVNVTFGWSNLFIQDLPGGGGPNYPLATPGVRLKVTPTNQIALLAAIFNGDPAGTGFTGLQKSKTPREPISVSRIRRF